MSGEVLLVVDGRVQDTATFNTASEKVEAIRAFLQVRYVIQHEQPYSDVRIDVRENTE